MATITSNGTGGGLSSSGTSWAGGIVPVEGDKVRIVSGDTIELNATHTWGDDTVVNTIGSSAINVYLGGVLQASRSVNSSLTAKGNILVEQGATLDFGTVASPIPAGVTCSLILNKATTPAVRDGLRQISSAAGIGNFINWSFVGDDTRMRGVNLASNATSGSANIILVTASHGWSVGDEILLPTSSGAPNLDESETRTVAAISGATITLSSAPTYTHLAGAPACNLSSNLVVRSFNEVSGQMANPNLFMPSSPIPAATAGYFATFRNVLFQSLGNTGSNSGVLNSSSGIGVANLGIAFYKCVCKNQITSASWTNVLTSKTTVFDQCVAYIKGVLHFGGGCVLYRDSWTVSLSAIALGGAGNVWENCWLTSIAGGTYVSSANQSFRSCTFSGYATALVSQASIVGITFEGCDIGFTYGWKNQFSDRFYRLTGILYATSGATLTDCLLNAAFDIPETTANLVKQQDVAVSYVNKNRDTTQQELYSHTALVARENAIVNRSSSSIVVFPSVTATDCRQSQKILCPNGASIRVIGYCRFDSAFYNSNNYNAPQVTLSGLGATQQTYVATAAANGAWEKFDLTITNNSGAGGNFTLAYVANAKAVTTGKVYFDGVPSFPFITKCRHYGYLFDEANPVRATNPSTLLSEAAAIGLTGISVTGGPVSSPVTLGASRTFQQLYDYTQAWSCVNLASAVPATGSGPAGSVSLFAAGSLTTTGYTLDGTGSISMGSFTLTANQPWPYTYTGGTFSQATGSGVPSFSGGSLAIGDGGTYTFKTTADTLVVVTPSAATSYTFTSGTFTGTLTLNNTTATPVTVFVPAGTATSSAGNTGGAITFSAPIIQQSVTINGVVPGSRVQIYDTTNSVELFNGTSGYAWTDSAAAVGDRAIRVRIAYQSGGTAKTFVEANIGTCGTTTVAAAVSYLASQVDDTVYNTNGIDGSTVSGITISDSIDRMLINIGGGSVSWKSIYAYNVHWLTTAAGIIDDGSIITAPDTANYIVIGFKIRNTSAMPLVITGGYGRDSVTDTVAACIDTAGSTGNIFPAPDHVIPYSVGSGLSAGEQAQLASAANAGNIVVSGGFVAADIKAVNGAAITGAGTPVSPWGP